MINRLVKILRNNNLDNHCKVGRVVGVAKTICSVEFKNWKGGHCGFEGVYEKSEDIPPVLNRNTTKQFGRWNFSLGDVEVIQDEQLEFDFNEQV